MNRQSQRTTTLSEPQKKMLEKLQGHDRSNPFVTAAGSEGSTLRALYKLGLVYREFAFPAGTLLKPRRIYWPKPQLVEGEQVLE